MSTADAWLHSLCSLTASRLSKNAWHRHTLGGNISSSVAHDFSFMISFGAHPLSLNMLELITYILSAFILGNAVRAAPTALSSRGKPVEMCPYGDDVEFGITVVDHWTLETMTLTNLQYMGKGSTGCAYEGILTIHADPETSTPERAYSVVAKTPRLTLKIRDFKQREIDALNRIEELYTYGVGSDSCKWLVMKKQPGKHLFETKAWRDMFPLDHNTDLSLDGISSCNRFINRIYRLILDKADEYALHYGWDQWDVNFNNFLFSDDLKTVNLVDWGRAKKVSQKPEDINAMRKERLEALKERSHLTTTDKLIKKTKMQQGICDSELRAAGEKWVNPMPSMELY